MTSQNEELEVKIQKNREKIISQGLNPDANFSIDDRYYCVTCGNIGKEHPNTAMCWICGDDNWEVVKGKESEVYG